MQTMVPLYGFGGGGGTGAVLTVKAPAGATVKVSKDGKEKTKVADASGAAVFKGLISGDWTITMTDGVQTSAPKTVTITTDYEAEISFFSATIHVRYPSGLSCTATCGDVTIPAPDASGVWDLVVSNAGTWVFKAGDVLTAEVTVVETGEAHTVNAWRDYIFKSGVGVVRELKNGFGANITIGTDTITIGSGTTLANGHLITQELINVNDYTSLKIETNTFSVSGANSGYQAALVFAKTHTINQNVPSNTSYFAGYTPIDTNAERFTKEFPITITGTYYPGIAGQCRGEILNLWLEKVVQ